MRNGVYLNPPYFSGAIEPAQASQMFATLGGGNITASSSGAVMPPVNQSSGVHQAFDPLNPPRNQPLSFVLPNVDKTIQEAPFHLESSQSHIQTFRMPESSEVIILLGVDQNLDPKPYHLKCIALLFHRNFPNLHFSLQDDASGRGSGKAPANFNSGKS